MTQSKTGDRLFTAAPNYSGIKLASSTVFLSELLSSVFSFFSFYTILVKFFYYTVVVSTILYERMTTEFSEPPPEGGTGFSY